MNFKRKKALGVFGLAAAAVLTMGLATGTAVADDYPSSNIRFVLHASPGGGTDVMARKLAAVIEPVLGQPFVIENRPGGRGAVALTQLERAKQDGYTVGSVTATHISQFNGKLDRYSIDDVEWIARVVMDPYLIAVPANSPIQSLKDVKPYIDKNPGNLTVAGFVRGSGGHIAWEIFADAAGIDSKSVNWVPYDSVKDGVTAVLGNHADLTVAYVGLVRDHVRSGKLRVLGIMADERAEMLKEAPTFAEAGFPGVDTNWQQFRGIIGPKGIPAERQEKLAAAIKQAMETEDFRQYMESAQLIPGFAGPQEFTAFAKRQDKATAQWLEKLGMKK
jgi:tripartite-type tricarboxylate transporter receptor subunit TctC